MIVMEIEKYKEIVEDKLGKFKISSVGELGLMAFTGDLKQIGTWMVKQTTDKNEKDVIVAVSEKNILIVSYGNVGNVFQSDCGDNCLVIQGDKNDSVQIHMTTDGYKVLYHERKHDNKPLKFVLRIDLNEKK